MKKSLITLAVASGLMASGAAFAGDTTVYGIGQVEIASWGGDATGVTVVDQNNGRVGVKSKEDLGEGMSALVKAEFKLDTADGVAGTTGVALTPRELMVGLKTGMGTVELGRLKSAYKYYGGVKYDPFVATVLQARNYGGMTGGTYGSGGFLSDSIAYENKVGAMRFRLTYSPDNGGPSSDKGAKSKTFGFAFNGGDYEVIVAYVDDGNETSSTNGNYKSQKVGGFYNMGSAGKITAQFESSKFDYTGGSDKIKTTYVDYQFNIDKSNGIDVALGTTKPDFSGAETEKFSRVAFTHKLSKKTKVWVGYRGTDSGYTYDSANYATSGVDANFAPIYTGKQSVIALGMMKKF
jgi:hypothetical protein